MKVAYLYVMQSYITFDCICMTVAQSLSPQDSFDPTKSVVTFDNLSFRGFEFTSRKLQSKSKLFPYHLEADHYIYCVGRQTKQYLFLDFTLSKSKHVTTVNFSESGTSIKHIVAFKSLQTTQIFSNYLSRLPYE